jgi:hypothetical protein
MADPRLYQIGTLATLLAYGMVWLDFDITAGRAALILATALGTQRIGDWLSGSPVRFASSSRSALISGLSLCLLLRTNVHAIACLAAVVAIASKFLIKVRGKHVFNPTDGALVALLLATKQVWVSPGQWGTAAFFAFLMACAGSLVVTRAARADVTLAFIVSFSAFVVGRSLYLGEPMAIPLHRLESGAFLLFSFFMISDPKTTPDSRPARIVFAALVAATAWYVQFRLFRTNGLLWSLAIWSMAVPVLDRLFPATRYQWTRYRPLNSDGLKAEGRMLNAECRMLNVNVPNAEWRMANAQGETHATDAVRGDARGGACLIERDHRRFLWVLRRQGRHQAVQPCLAGRSGARRQPHGDDDGQRLRRRFEGVRHRHSGTDIPQTGADPRR